MKRTVTIAALRWRKTMLTMCFSIAEDCARGRLEPFSRSPRHFVCHHDDDAFVCTREHTHMWVHRGKQASPGNVLKTHLYQAQTQHLSLIAPVTAPESSTMV